MKRFIFLLALAGIVASLSAPAGSAVAQEAPEDRNTLVTVEAAREAIHERMLGLFSIDGVVFTDIDEKTGRFVVGVERFELSPTVAWLLELLAVPADSVEFVEVPAVHQLATLRDTTRPLQGGTQIHFSNFLCTLGFNVVRGGVAGFVTNSHCTTTQGGTENTQYYQPLSSIAPTVIGREVADPSYFTGSGCPSGSVCRSSDSAFVEYQNGVSGDLGVIAKTSGANNGSLTILGNFDIVGEGSATTGTVNKVGRTTGWTQGSISGSCVNVGVSGTNIVQLCQNLVTSTSQIVAGGDSGSGVFTIVSGNDVELQGILWGGSTDGKLFVYSPLANIESELGALTTFGGGSNSDTTPPTVSSTSPVNNAIGISPEANISANFSEALNSATVNASSFTLTGPGSAPVAGSVSYASQTATFNPTSSLAPDTTYTARLTTAIEDSAGISLAANHVWSFTTEPNTPPPTPGTFLDCNSQAAVTSNSGDDNGYQTSPDSACSNGGGHAEDGNSGSSSSESCSSSVRDRHIYYDYNVPVPSGASINGIEVRLDAWAESTSRNPAICVELSWDGGDSWTTAKQTPTLSTSETTFILGSAGDLWGRTWTAAELSNANFRVRVTDIATSSRRDFRLDWVAVKLTTSGGGGPDETPPLVTSTAPTSNETNVSVDSPVSATFNEALNPATVSATTFTLTGPGLTPVVGIVSYSSQVATFTPSNPLAYDTVYTATLTTGIQDLADPANALAANYVWSFTTEPNTPPEVTSTAPTSNETDVSVASEVNASFSESLDPVTVSATTFTVTGPGLTPVVGIVSYSSQVATFTPSNPLAYDTVYTATLTTGIQDLADPANALAANYVWSFTTEPNTPPPTPGTFLDCNSQAAVTSNSGDDNGYQTSPDSACSNGGGHAEDGNSGSSSSESCSSSVRDRHIYYDYNVPVPSGASINGIEVRLDAWAESTSRNPAICVELSWDGGDSWTTAKQTPTLSTGESTYILGSPTDNWGRTWTAAELSNANFRVRVTDIATSTRRDFRLDWVALQIY